MLKFIIRLDDACESMDENKWKIMENLLDKYNIKPIVGIIPENQDPQFCFGKIQNFWVDYAKKWQDKGWIIAQHGLYHKYYYYKKGRKKIRTEFYGLDYKTQKAMLEKGYSILKKHKIIPVAFFAPNHTFDATTLKACSDLKYYKFISDGYAQYPFYKDGMILFPSIFDTPHKILNHGIYTFVFHPNYIDDNKIKYLEEFIIRYKDNFNIDFEKIIKETKDRRRNIIDVSLGLLIHIYRFVKGNNGNE